MLFDETKLAVDSTVSILNCRKQHTNLKLRASRLKRKQNFPEQNCSTNAYHNRPIQIAQGYRDGPIQIAHYGFTSQSSQLTYLRNKYLEQ